MARTTRTTTRNRRRRFGKVEMKTNRHGQIYYDASYIPPVEARERYPHLPSRIHRNFDEGYELQADAWLSEAKRLIDLGAWEPPEVTENRNAGNTVTFHEYAERFVENRRKGDNQPIRETTKDKYRQYVRDYLNPILGDLPMAEIKPAHICDWYDSMKVTKDGRGESIRRHVFELLNAIMAEAANTPLDDQGTTLIKVNPVQFKVPRPATKHAYVIATREQVKALADAMTPNLALGVLLAGTLGLRQGEVLGLQRRDIELDTSPVMLHVRRSAKEVSENGHKVAVLGETKTPSSKRDIEVPAPLAEEIKRHLDTYVGGKPTDLLFTGVRTRGIVRAQSLRNVFAKAIEATGDPALKGMDFHDLRHTGLTHYAEQGATVGQLMRLGGHTNIKTVATYQQSSADADKRLLAKVEASMGGTVTAENDPQRHSPGNPSDADQPSEPSASATPDTAADAEMKTLADVLAALELQQRLAVLKGLDDDKRGRILTLLPSTVQVDTIQGLIKAVA
ncbi:tyrosine-type recombinase/integrase [Bifidobacterium avesanii]|uniref:Tyrosine-type recombinase/integrase n=1 Tax=Bifidobacterium avesanii TaxID=1798157 RepID=A0A7K3TL04_9BIFI|nr:tyrosine-type recombinase/integrase [Bifidobacterium avesanii]KAB8290099.1 integrase [Bifidobacterium avesanii]NEG78953.1 tyrosine-type recombinase/integrase [Bifidobacterium avesanii]